MMLTIANGISSSGNPINDMSATSRRRGPMPDPRHRWQLPTMPRAEIELRSGFFLRLQDLPALIHSGLQVEVMRPPQLAGILVLDIGRLFQRIRRAAHATS